MTSLVCVDEHGDRELVDFHHKQAALAPRDFLATLPVHLDLAEVLQLVQGFKDGELATELGRGSIGDPVHQPIHLWQEVVVSLPGDLVVQPQILQRQVSSSRAWRQGLRRRAADLAGADVGLVG